MDFSKETFRCSSLGHLLTEPKSAEDKKLGNLSESAKTHLIDVYVSRVYGRKTDVHTRYTEKGLSVEEDSITLYSRVAKKLYKKNDTRLYNEFIQGELDLYTGTSVGFAETVIDIKSSWDVFTFFRNHKSTIKSLYYWQLQGYMYLTGAKSAKLAYCLISTPVPLIEAEQRKLWYAMGQPDDSSKIFKDACAEIVSNMTYEDIPLKQRLMEFDVERNEADIAKIGPKVLKAREFLKEMYETLNRNTSQLVTA